MSYIVTFIARRVGEAVTELFHFGVEKAVNGVSEQDPKDAFDDLYRRGTAHLMARDLATAESLLSEALRLAQENDLHDRALAASQSLFLARQ